MEKHPQAQFKCITLDDEIEFRAKIEGRKIPRYLFKYMDVTTSLLFLNNAQLLYSCPFLFNDPFDCMANVFIDKISPNEWYHTLLREPINPKAVEFFIERNKIDAQYSQDMVYESIEASKKNYGILCLTTKNDSILMWSHYSNKHKGICIKFDISCDCQSFYTPQKVEYSNTYPKFHFLKDKGKFEKSLCHKSKDWKYENEYRVIKKGGYGLKTINKKCVVSIIFGCKMEESDEKKIRLKVEENNFCNVRFQRAVQDKESYKLNIIDIE